MKKEIKKFIELTKKNLERNVGCGGWCIRCSLANALSSFDDTNGGISTMEAIRQVATNDIFPISKMDFLLEKTRDYLKKFDYDMVFKTKKQALNFLNKYSK